MSTILIVEAGFDACVGKPIGLAEFLEAVRTQLALGPRVVGRA